MTGDLGSTMVLPDVNTYAYACSNGRSCEKCGTKHMIDGKTKRRFKVNGGIKIDSKEIGSLTDCWNDKKLHKSRSKIDKLERIEDASPI